jgi:hypothetical protein
MILQNMRYGGDDAIDIALRQGWEERQRNDAAADALGHREHAFDETAFAV